MPLSGPVETLIESWERSLRARNLSPNTINLYVPTVRRFAEAAGVDDVDEFTRDHVRAWLATFAGSSKPWTAKTYHRALQQWFKWLHAEDEITVDPMVGVKPPIVPDEPVPVVDLDVFRRLLASCAGKTFNDRRDSAILRLFLDAGVRLNEMAGIAVEDVSLRDQFVVVHGKGRRDRVVPFGAKVAQAVDRYLRVRARHPQAGDPMLWLGTKGPLVGSGVYQMVVRRAKRLGIELHPHQLRHTFAHEWLADGGNEGDLMQLMGWKSRKMVDRYGSSAAAQRARDAHRRRGLGDRV